jgi:sulfate adenylyltransferase
MVQRELDVAKKILADIPIVLGDDHLKDRTWNLLPYHRYRGSDEPNEQNEVTNEK